MTGPRDRWEIPSVVLGLSSLGTGVEIKMRMRWSSEPLCFSADFPCCSWLPSTVVVHWPVDQLTVMFVRRQMRLLQRAGSLQSITTTPAILAGVWALKGMFNPTLAPAGAKHSVAVLAWCARPPLAMAKYAWSPVARSMGVSCEIARMPAGFRLQPCV